MPNTNSREVLWGLLRTGLFSSKDMPIISHDSSVDWDEVYRLSEEQSVVGIVFAGIESLPASEKPPRAVIFQFIGSTMQIEQRNQGMNEFVTELIDKLTEADVFALLVKGQGVAQCYERPMWRSSGDVDLLLSDKNYEKAKSFIESIADSVARGTRKNRDRKHQEYRIGTWTVELHGTMHSNLSHRIDRGIDDAQNKVFHDGKVRVWANERTQVFLPAADEDVIFVFAHILQHLFFEGVGLRQICDWCRLLWAYRNALDENLLEHRIRNMGLMSEWQVLGTMAVEFLGMPREAMPFLNNNQRKNKKLNKKATMIMDFVMDVGNFGHNREVEWSDGFKRRTMLIWHRITDTIRLSRVFPIDAPKFLINYAIDGMQSLFQRMS